MHVKSLLHAYAMMAMIYIEMVIGNEFKSFTDDHGVTMTSSDIVFMKMLSE